MHYLVTGGCGYIGSITASLLCEQKEVQVTLIDNLLNNDASAADTLKAMYPGRVHFEQVDVRNADSLRQVFSSAQFDGVLHFAGLKSVSESQIDPLSYCQLLTPKGMSLKSSR